MAIYDWRLLSLLQSGRAYWRIEGLLGSVSLLEITESATVGRIVENSGSADYTDCIGLDLLNINIKQFCCLNCEVLWSWPYWICERYKLRPV